RRPAPPSTPIGRSRRGRAGARCAGAAPAPTSAGSSAGAGRPVLLPRDLRHVGPQALELVVAAGVLVEHVHDEVAVVEQHPGEVVEALDADRLRSALLGDTPL